MNNLPTSKNKESGSKSILAKNLSTLIRLRGINDAQLAKALNLPYNTIKRLTSGETSDPRYSTLKLIADYFNVSIDIITEDNQAGVFAANNKTKPKFVPILEWDFAAERNDLDNLILDDWTEWTLISYDCAKQASEHIFALKSRPSMSPRFQSDSILIIDPQEKPTDGDTILVRMLNDNSLSMKELVVDSPTWLLHPIVIGSEILKFNPEEHHIIGVLILTMLYKR